MDQTQIEWLVRLTARVSGTAFAVALLVFALGDRRRLTPPLSSRLFALFIVAHTIHFGAVGWLAVLSAGENIRARGGWIVVLAVALLFYLAAFGILLVWRDDASGRARPGVQRLAAHVSVAFIAVVFLNSYLGRVESRPVYWLPVIGMVVVVALYFWRVRAQPRPAAPA